LAFYKEIKKVYLLSALKTVTSLAVLATPN